MLESETKTCQSCKNNFVIEPEDFEFYQKINVPQPTWCPECRMIRRFVWRNERTIFRRKDSVTGKEIISEFHPEISTPIYPHTYWYGDTWDPMEYGRSYDFSRPFFEQFKELLELVPAPSQSVMNIINSEYNNNVSDLKNCYLCFHAGGIENSAYVVGANTIKDSFDLYHTKNAELCYYGYMIDESYKIFFSINCEASFEVWFSKNLIGCNNCFGCINLRKKSYCIFNKQVSKEEYLDFIADFNSGSFQKILAMQEKVYAFWKNFPDRFTLGFRNVNSTGEHLQDCKNVNYSFDVHDGLDLKYCQDVTDSKDSYDHSIGWESFSLCYENNTVADAYNIKFSYKCWPNVSYLRYAIFCLSSSHLFGCVGLRKKEYCIFNKQYTKEEYKELVPKIIKHMDDMPYIDKMGRIYKFGEFFPPEFSPFAYNETIAQDFFPLTKEEIEEKGFLYREAPVNEYQITMKAEDLPDAIEDLSKDATDQILKEVIECIECKRAYRIIEMELSFYRRIPLPLPRSCYKCRFAQLFKFVNPPKFWKRKCHCTGTESENNLYKNTAEHIHGTEPCPIIMDTSYAPEKTEIVYCEKCYQQEVA